MKKNNGMLYYFVSAFIVGALIAIAFSMGILHSNTIDKIEENSCKCVCMEVIEE